MKSVVQPQRWFTRWAALSGVWVAVAHWVGNKHAPQCYIMVIWIEHKSLCLGWGVSHKEDKIERRMWLRYHLERCIGGATEVMYHIVVFVWIEIHSNHFHAMNLTGAELPGGQGWPWPPHIENILIPVIFLPFSHGWSKLVFFTLTQPSNRVEKALLNIPSTVMG